MDRITDPYYQALWPRYWTCDFLHVRYSSTCVGNPTRYTPVLQHPTFPTDALYRTFPWCTLKKICNLQFTCYLVKVHKKRSIIQKLNKTACLITRFISEKRDWFRLNLIYVWYGESCWLNVNWINITFVRFAWKKNPNFIPVWRSM
jgi:hypothetical protein